jgi:hypothetical protein
MKKLVTLKQLTEFTQNEKEIIDSVFESERPQPKSMTIQSLLNFSKSLSVRNSKSIGNIEMVLS